MKAIIPATLVLLLAGCASSTAMEDNRVLDCASGRDIEVLAGIDSPPSSMFDLHELTYVVEVANNSHEDVVVDFIRVQTSGSRFLATFEPVSRSVNQGIAQGKDHLFRFTTTRSLTSVDETHQRSQTIGAGARLDVMVKLTNGDAYRCAFGFAM